MEKCFPDSSYLSAAAATLRVARNGTEWKKKKIKIIKKTLVDFRTFRFRGQVVGSVLQG